MAGTLTLEQQRLGGLKSVEAKRLRRELPWQEQEMIRVRGHIARLNKDLDECADPVDILRLTQALSKLYEVAGLPKAGAYRPMEAKKAKPSAIDPLD